MFHSITPSMLDRMQYLEAIDGRDRQDGTPRPQRLRQIPPDTGRFLALLAAGAPAGDILEIGTSAGYSTLWLSLADRPLTTFELLPAKAELARQTFRAAGVEQQVRLVHGDAREHLENYEQIAFCFIDAEKEIYEACYDLAVPRLVSGGFLVADNAVSHQAELQPFIDRALADVRVDALVATIGKGLLLCRKV
jgi:caffeoyl-CoA O-methyltransferase